jgi:signal transduction histidine kinase
MKSIRGHLTRSLTLLLGVLLVVVGLGIFFAARAVLLDQFDETLEAKAQAILTATEVDDGELEIELTLDDFGGFGAGGDYFEIRRESSEVVIASPSLEGPRQRKVLGEVTLPGGMEPMIVPGVMGDSGNARYFVQRFRPRGKRWDLYPDLHLVVASPTDALERTIFGLGLVLGIAGAVTLAATVAIVRSTLSRGLAPLHRLSAGVTSIGSDELNRRIPERDMPDELLPLAAGLNTWLAQLEISFERERRFSSDAAHELRTPLAELKTMAEAGARWKEEAGPERFAEMLEVIGELESLLEKLALLARAESGRQPLQTERVECRAALDAVIVRLAPRVSERNLRIAASADGALRTDPDLLATILGNVIGNAVDYAPSGSSVHIGLNHRGLRVVNPAPKLDPADVPHLFERFWRKDASRTGYGHSGLGLSIVRACAALLGARCEARLLPTSELEVVVVWRAESIGAQGSEIGAKTSAENGTRVPSP